MDGRRMFVVGVVAVALGLGAAAWFAPSTDVAEAPQLAIVGPARAPTGPVPAPDAANARPPRPYDVGPGPIPPVQIVSDTGSAPSPGGVPPREPPPDLMDLDQTYTPDMRGILTAAMGRRDRIVGCYDSYRADHGDFPGRLTLRMTVEASDGGTPAVWAEMAAAMEGAEDFDECVTDALADATFAPTEGDVSVLWPVPVARGLPPTPPIPGAYRPR